MTVRIKVKKYLVADLDSLTRLVLQFIYERDRMPLAQIEFMEHSITAWGKKLQTDLDKNILIPGYEPDYAEQLQWLGQMLQKDANHEFDERKRMFSYHNIDYKKFHRLPGANTPKDIELAQRVYAAYKAKHAEQEDMGEK